MAATQKIKSFLIKEVALVINPTNHTEQYFFANLDELVDTFLLLLLFESEEFELQETGNKILKSLSEFAGDHIEVDRLINSIEALATAFEPFLKIIAEIRYSSHEPIKFKGDGTHYLGLLKTTLGDLLLGKVAKVNPRDGSVPIILAPVVSFSYSSTDVRNQIYASIRTLRNEVHVSPSRNLSQIFQQFKVCLAAYFFAIEENIVLVRLKVDPIFNYLANIKNSFESLSRVIVSLDSEASSEIDDDWTSLQVLEKDTSSEREKLIRKAPIEQVLEDNDQLWLIGEPGSGKTTSLKGHLYTQATYILSKGYLFGQKVPLMIESKLIDDRFDLIKYLQRALRISDTRLTTLLINENVKLLFDGINELPDILQVKIQDEIRKLLQDYENLSIVVTSRRYGFEKLLNFKVFELLPLNVEQIEAFIKKYIANKDKADNLFNKIIQSDNLVMDFAQNPMLLKMLIQVGVKEDIQPNFGLLFQKFIKWILDRERQKSLQVDEIVKEKILAELAFNMRSNYLRAIEQDRALIIISSSIKVWNENIGPVKFLREVLDNRIIVKNTNEQLSFFHELVLEYYTAVKLKELFILQKESVRQYCDKTDWYEPLIILSGLLTDPDELVKIITDENIVLAARCISSGSNVSKTTVLKLYEECKQRLETEEREERETVTALLEMSTPESFRLVIKYLGDKKNSFTAALSRCQRPEITALKLLNFGLTGKHRIRQCLKVFVGKPNSFSFINSKAISDAEIILMSDKVELDDLDIIEKLGISNEALSLIKTKVIELCRTQSVQSRIFVKACEMVSRVNADDHIYTEIEDRICDVIGGYTHGRDLYDALRILKSIHGKIKADNLINRMFVAVANKKYYQLLLEYILAIDIDPINGIDRGEFIKNAIENIAMSGKTEVLLHYKKKFPEYVDNSHLIKVFSVCIEQEIKPYTLAFYGHIKTLLKQKELLKIKEQILTKNMSGIKTSKLLQWINKLELLPYFTDYAVVFKSYENSGLAFKVDTFEILHFRFYSNSPSLFIKNRFLKIKTIIPKTLLNGTRKRNFSFLKNYEIVK